MSFALHANEPKEILLLHSYNKGLKWSDGISQGVHDVLLQHPEYELTTEYMDSKKIDTKEYFNSLLNLYTQKFSKRTYKAIIAADNYAYEFVLSNHDNLFQNAPIVFTGVENFHEETIPINLRQYITGVVEYKKVKENLDLINKVLPNIKTIYIISDNSFSSLQIKEQILNAAKKYKNDFSIIYDNEIDINTINTKINQLPSNSAVLFTSLYKDRFGTYIPYNKLRILFKSSKFPVFALNKIHLYEGILGGMMITPYDQGFSAANKAFEIIDGKNPSQINISKPEAKYYFDYKIMEKFNIDRLKLPLNSIIVNKPKSFFEKNRKIVDSAFLMLPILIFLIAILIMNIMKQIKLEGKLVEQNKLDSVLLNNIKNSIFWKSKDGILLGCNNSLCVLLSLKKEEIIGKHINQVMPEFCEAIGTDENFIHEVETNLYNTAKRKINVLIRRKQYFNKKEEEAGVVTVISDITDIRKLETQRKKDEQFMIQRSKLSEIGEMITSIAHQWKAPLVEISAIAQELQYKRKKTQISQKDADNFVHDIMTQATYMTSTIDDFRSFIKPSTHKSDFSINKAIKELLNVIDHSIKYNYIDIDILYENDQEYIIFGYPNEFKQSILNIINNAKDSIIKRKEKEDIVGKISLHVKNIDDAICISIKDNGIGIDEKNLESIFEPFVTSKQSGDGFGLYMVKLIIEDKMGGSIKALKCDSGAQIIICVQKPSK